jgi:Tfp pilus assembly protein PilF
MFCRIQGFVLLLLVSLAAAQSHDHAHIGYVPREIMSRPIALETGIGTFHEKVTASSVQAQKFYDQGQAYLHSYMWIEAARSFNQALRLDRKLGMAYLGLSYAFSPIDYDAARESLDRSDSLASSLSDREKQRIQVRRLQLEAMLAPQDSARLVRVREALDTALQLTPNDLELLLLRGNAEEPTPFADGQGCVAASIPYYANALKIHEGRFAAEHYLAHCYENTGNAAEALAHAQNYARAAPAVPHAQHMLGHELLRNGQLQQAIVQFVTADALEKKYARAERIPSYLNWHHAHNLALLADCYQAIGQMKSAEFVLKEEIATPVFTDYAMMNRSNWPLFLLTRDRFAEAQHAAQAMQSLPSPLAQATAHALAGQADMQLNNHELAATELGKASTISAGLNPPDAAALRPHLLLLQIELKLKAGNNADALEGLRELSRRIRSANSPDTSAVERLQLEAFSSFARKTGVWDLAAEAAKTMISHDPDYAAGHYALALCAEHQKDAGTASREFQEALQRWSHADPDLPELRYARQHATEGAVQNSRLNLEFAKHGTLKSNLHPGLVDSVD